MSGRNMFQEQVVELRSLLRQRFALLRLNSLITSELEPAEKQLGEQLIEGYGKGGIDMGMDNDIDDLLLYANSGLDQQFSIDLLSQRDRIDGHPTQEVFRRFLNDYLPRVSGRSHAAPVSGSVTHHFEFHCEIAVRGYRFRPLDPTFQWDWSINAVSELPHLLQQKNALSFLECRTLMRRFCDHHAKTMTGILTNVFTHTQEERDTVVSRQMYAVCRWFKWVDTNQYRYHEEAALDIQTFSPYDLSPPFFLHINSRTVSSLHPVALLTVPKWLSSPDGDALIASIPIARKPSPH
ncbi:hypothetical protein AYX14_06999 [Cryptococcus neoformans]|nr:hypothetical protein AYX14_06999 [Cryptococcus neoformans var. grubii]